MCGVATHIVACILSSLSLLFCFLLQYCDRYGDHIGFPHLEEWRKELCLSALRNADTDLETYRDFWDDHELLQEALQSPHFTQHGAQDFPL